MKKIIIVAFLLYLIPIQAQKEYSYVYSNDSIIKRGIALYEKQNYSDAIKEYDRIGKVDPEYYTAQYEKLLALTTMDKKDDARTLFEQLYKDNKMPEAPNLFMLYGSFLSDEKKYDEAEKVFKERRKKRGAVIPEGVIHFDKCFCRNSVRIVLGLQHVRDDRRN